MRFIIWFWSKKGCCTDKKYPASNSNEVFQNQLNDISYKDWASFANKIFCPRVYLNEILYSAAKIKNIILKLFNTLQQTVFDVLLFKFKNL